MIKEIVTNRGSLSMKCQRVAIEDDISHIIKDLEDTLESLGNDCAGLAANQIGYDKRVIIVRINGNTAIMVNPVYVPLASKGRKTGNETCFSFPGVDTKIKRYKSIKVSFLNEFTAPILLLPLKDFEARLVQHEIDHLNGKLI